jgi:hypothetical protein
MCWKCEELRQWAEAGVRIVSAHDVARAGTEFDISDAMIEGYAERHGCSFDQAADAFIFAAGGIQPSRRWH